MEILVLLIPIAMILASLVALAFFWAASSGQFDELDSAGESIFFDDEDHDERTDTPREASCNAAESQRIPDNDKSKTALDDTTPLDTPSR